jgi:hypothetical protein
MRVQSNFGRYVTLNSFMQIVLVVFLTAAVQAASGLTTGDPGAKADACAQTSQAALKACKQAAHEAFWLAIGKCDNVSDSKERRACILTAKEDKNPELDLCAKQFDARNTVCQDLGEGPYDPVINPANFVKNVVGNNFFPLIPNTIYTYESDTERIVVNVTGKTTKILNITCRVVRDTATDKKTGELIEDTIDWYAQDKDGNVWYFGEISQQFEQGELTGLKGSWKAGVGGAKPGIVMEVNPQKGNVYRQEFLLGTAEDLAKVLGSNNTVTVATGTYNNCLKTSDFSPLEPGVKESKFYAPGVGLIFTTSPDGTREELVKVEHK